MINEKSETQISKPVRDKKNFNEKIYMIRTKTDFDFNKLFQQNLNCNHN